MSEFTPSFKTRLINRIDESETPVNHMIRWSLDRQAEDYAELNHGGELRRAVDDVIENIKSDYWDIEDAEDMRRGLDEWQPTELIYTSDIEAAVCRAGVDECFRWLNDHYGEPASSLNELYSAVYWDMRGAVEAVFINLAEEVEEETEED
ncbi:hypothetical protein ACU4IU_00225 [Brevibacterium sp. CSND-B09]|uniref:hypothetical protein n=1 Tax=Brevibacterium sp. CSND-B09 TaxID=3462571 RepID=UPI00406A8812